VVRPCPQRVQRRDEVRAERRQPVATVVGVHETWDALQSRYQVPQLVELLVLAGWYRMISYVANGLLIEDEQWADLRAWS
jgi:hypothetical protein